jgi:hypothetical protein
VACLVVAHLVVAHLVVAHLVVAHLVVAHLVVALVLTHLVLRVTRPVGSTGLRHRHPGRHRDRKGDAAGEQELAQLRHRVVSFSWNVQVPRSVSRRRTSTSIQRHGGEGCGLAWMKVS